MKRALTSLRGRMRFVFARFASVRFVSGGFASVLFAGAKERIASRGSARTSIATAGLACVLFVVIFALTFALTFTGLSLPRFASERTAEFSASSLLEKLTPKIRRIHFTNARHISEDELYAALSFRLGDALWKTDLSVARESLARLAWVRDLELHRTLDGTVTIQIVERTPCARHQQNGIVQVIDTQGVTLPNASLREFAELPALIGQGAEAGCAFWSEWQAATREFNAQLLAAARMRNRRWDLFLSDGVVLSLPEENWRRALSRLASLERDYGLVSYVRGEARQIKADNTAEQTPLIDLRVGGRVRLRGLVAAGEQGV